MPGSFPLERALAAKVATEMSFKTEYLLSKRLNLF
jgi:hypothetical protein